MNALFSDGPTRHNARSRGWVFYDAECSFCTSLARRLEPMLLRRGFHCAGLQEPWVGLVLGLRGEELLSEFRVRKASGEVLGGADALLHLARHIWWAWPLYALGRIPSPRDLLRAAYRWFAARRHCVSVCPSRVSPTRHLG
jgi:predicted DCC family thiol-disulfide oxidoreductase YuxK